MQQQYDVLIVGTGAAGLYAALQFPPSVRVLLLSKRELLLSNSALAQGGVAAVLDKSHDNFKLHIADTLIAGCYKNDLHALEILVSEGPNDVQRLLNLGVHFDMDDDGRLQMTLEGGHSRRRIVHHKDTTGREIVETLSRHVRELENVELAENAMLVGLDRTDGGFSADILIEENLVRVGARFCILATGGIGRVYEYTTNSAIATGDGIACAHLLGASIKNISLVQFHPTAFAAEPDRERFLISEAVRGEGGILLNSNGERFMTRYDERGELAPRDVVSHAIMDEEKRLGDSRFYLDISFLDAEFIKDRFPMIYSRCLEEEIDITKEKIPVYPCQHYLMGGIDVDELSRTTVDRLYACGECSHSGVHGQNRLASNSLLEALVFSRRAATDIISRLDSEGKQKLNIPPIPELNGKDLLPSGLRTEIRHIMQEAYFISPVPEKISAGLIRLEEIKSQLLNGSYEMSHDLVEARSLAVVAYLILNEVNSNCCCRNSL